MLGQAGGTVVRVREDDVFGVEVRKNGSAAMGAVGVLLGIPAGLILGGLVCVTIDECSAGMLWGGVLVGGILGGVAHGQGRVGDRARGPTHVAPRLAGPPVGAQGGRRRPAVSF